MSNEIFTKIKDVIDNIEGVVSYIQIHPKILRDIILTTDVETYLPDHKTSVVKQDTFEKILNCSILRHEGDVDKIVITRHVDTVVDI